jgi:hypothetical protein
MAISWSEVLDLYGRALLDFEYELDNGSVGEFTFTLPANLGPLPPELAPVAVDVAERSSRIEGRVREAMAQTAREQVAVTRARRRAARGRPRPRFIDIES